MKNKCVLIGGGDLFFDPARMIDDQSFVIGVDRGLDALLKYKLKPDLLIGDFDSTDLQICDFSCPAITLPVNKDETDLLAAIKYGLLEKYSQFAILGGVGGKRVEHTLGNIQCLYYLLEHGASGLLFTPNGHGRIRLIKGPARLAMGGKKGDGVSILSYSTQSFGVTLEGFEYPLDNVVLNSAYPLGLSNSIAGDEARISLKEGVLLIVEYDCSYQELEN